MVGHSSAADEKNYPIITKGLGKIRSVDHESRGTLVSQYKYRTDKTGRSRRCGPYISLVLRIDEDSQAWIYLGKQDSSRYRSRLDQALGIMVSMPRASNAEIATALRSMVKSSFSQPLMREVE